MADIKISLSNIQNIKSVLIEPFGDFKVRKLGAGEELDLSERLRRLNKIVLELQQMERDNVQEDIPTPEGLKKLETIQKRTDKLSEEISEIKKFEIETYSRCFDDGEGGVRTKELFQTMSADDRTAVFKAIFNPTVLDDPNEAEIGSAEDEEHS